MKNVMVMVVGACWMTVMAGAALVDDFNSSHDYLVNGVAGTSWDGILNASAASTLDANLSHEGTLTISLGADNVGWDNTHSNAPFLYMEMPVNFDVSVHVVSSTVGNYLNGGILARMSDNNFMCLNYNTFSTGSYVALRSVLNGAKSDYNLEVNYTYLRMVKQGALFTVYAKETSADSWTELKKFTRSDMDHMELQVGLSYANYSALDGGVQFDDFVAVPEPLTACLLAFGSLLMHRRK